MPLAGLKTSTNKIYAGSHWSIRKTIKDSFSTLAAVYCKPAYTVSTYPVQIRYRFSFVKNSLDTLNTAYMAKMLEDAMVGLNILENDDPRYVARSTLEVVNKQKEQRPRYPRLGPESEQQKEDYVVITIEQYDRNTN